MGIKKNSRWTDALAEELHKPVTRKFQKRRVIARGVDNIWAADLVDMKAFAKDNEGVKYLLTVLDVFSKYGWTILPIVMIYVMRRTEMQRLEMKCVIRRCLVN